MFRYQLVVVFLIAIFLAACAVPVNRAILEPSYLELPSADKIGVESSNDISLSSQEEDVKATMTLLEEVVPEKYLPNKPVEYFEELSATEMVRVSADKFKLSAFVHYVFGEVLGLNYILDPSVEVDTQGITLNLFEQISHRQFFKVAEELLNERGYQIQKSENIFSIEKISNGKSGSVVYGFGNNPRTVPNTNLDIVQVVPLKYGTQTQMLMGMSQFAQVQVLQNERQNAFMLRGKRQEIVKALEYINFFDQPLLRDRLASFYQPTYITTKEVVSVLKNLLAQEGISIGQGAEIDKAVSMVTIDRTGMIVFFAQDQKILDRVEFWLNTIDQPIRGNEMRYFFYQPEFARATDLGESLSMLIGGGSRKPIGSSVSADQQNKEPTGTISSGLSARGDGLEMVVDEKSNSIIFNTTGTKYQQILPLVKRLDVLPKQVVLEVVIAEVSLTDEFKQGVEFALQKANFGLSTSGAFMGNGFGGLSYLLTGSEGQVAVNMLESNSLVNIVSRPTLVVRDGVSASIQVGTDIPVIGSTTSDPISGDKQTTNIEYRSTGVQLSVTPTVNTKGIIIMSISQSISNQVDSGSTSAINPSVFMRTLSTEVIAASGQTVLLGGLISETSSKKNSSVPLLGRLPLLGKLFSADTDSGDKTELVVLVTPRVIDDQNAWDSLKKSISDQFKSLNIWAE